MADNKEYSQETEIKENDGVKLSDEELEGAVGGSATKIRPNNSRVYA